MRIVKLRLLIWIYGKCSTVFDSFFYIKSRKKFIQDDHSCKLLPTIAGDSQCYIIGSTLFSIVINKLPDDISSKIYISADDTIFYPCHDNKSDQIVNVKLAAVRKK